jgi:proline dehydrogenase
MSILSILAHSRSAFLDPDRNPVLHYLLKKTFYAQFCAGETREEIKATVGALKGLGYKGVILCYAKEVVMESDVDMKEKGSPTEDSATEYREVELWKRGTLETISLMGEGDFVALKYAALPIAIHCIGC